MNSSPIDTLHRLLLSDGRFDYSDEMICQNAIAQFLDSKSISFLREYELAGSGVCDFYFPNSRIVLEVKAGKGWSKRGVYRQCERYCQHEDVSGLVLATGKIQGMPETISNKPIRVYQLGLGFL